jgi:hypothetical protein
MVSKVKYPIYAVAPDSTQSTLFADLKFGFEFRAKYTLNNNLYGNNQHATATGSLASVGLLDPYGLNCTNTSFIALPDTQEKRFGAKDWSIAFLFKPQLSWTGGFSYSMLFANEQYSIGRRIISATLYQATSSPDYNLDLLVNHPLASVGIIIPANNRWYLGVYTHNAATKTLNAYLDGLLAGSGTYTGSMFENTDPFYVGTRCSSGSNFDNGGVMSGLGKLQYIYKWDRLLTPAEISWLYNSGSYRFLSK